MKESRGSTCAIIVAAGSSRRMGGVDKLFAELVGRPLLAWTVGAFKRAASIDDIIIVAAPDGLERVSALVREWRFDDKVLAVVPGGETRQASVAAGLAASDGAEIVAVHDGARPLVTDGIIDEGVRLAWESGAAICAVRARDTIKVVEGEPPVVRGTPDRSTMWLAQTPQCFRRDVLAEAHARATTEATDDAALVEASGQAVRVYDGAAYNFKVTTAEDLIIADALLRERFAAGR